MTTLSSRKHTEPTGYSQIFIAFFMAVECFFTTASSYAKSYSFTWSENPEPVAGYKLYYKKGGDPAAPFNGIDAIEGSSPITVGKQTTFTLTGLEDNTTYHFALTAYYDTVESGYSEIISVFDTFSSPLTAIIITTSKQGVAPLIVTFDGLTSTGLITNYVWSFGDGESATSATATHTYQIPGSYTASLTVSDSSGQSHNSIVQITVTAPPPPPPTVPTVVIASSSAVGNAPFTVQFDGSGSSSAQSPIVSYAWDFGDSSSGQGTVVAHTFTTPGTYSTTLTVTDSIGLINQASTPVIITLPPPEINKSPVALFTATPTSGKAPLTVAFDGSSSNDPDGSISKYVWSFGDGSSVDGVSTEHIFTNAGDFVVTLCVTDNRGATAVTSQKISILPPDEIDFELLEVQADHNWTKFTLSKPFISPVIVAGPPSYTDTAPATIRIRNITNTSFEARIQEWDYLDGKHAFEKFSLIVMEKGVYTLLNGSKLEAGTFTGTTSFRMIALQQNYAVTPVILTQVATYNEADAVVGRMRNSTPNSFEFRMQEQLKNRNSHTPETVGYIAWEPGKGEFAGLIYEIGFTAKVVTQNWFTLSFKTTFPTGPLFIAGMQTYASSDTATVRTQNLNQKSTQIKIEEETSKDLKINHSAEVVGYISIDEK
jgi:PKD repeat protein